MTEDQQGSAGILNSVLRIESALLRLLHTRAELFAVELQEEKLRAARTLVWLATGTAFGVGGVLVAVVGMSLYSWQVAGYRGLFGLALAASGVAAIILRLVRRRLLQGARPFAQTIAEFAKDAEVLRHRRCMT